MPAHTYGRGFILFYGEADERRDHTDRVRMSLNRIAQHPSLGSGILAAALFAVTLGGTYIYDDHGIILEDKRIAGPGRWDGFWTRPYSEGADRLYRPLISISYAIQWRAHGNRPWAFHLVNVILHALASALVAALGTRLLGLAGGWIAGAIFAVHPAHVEAVANIVGRAELMCAIGMLGAMLLILGPMTHRRAIDVTFCLLLALLSKEQGLLLPPLLWGIWLLLRAPFRGAGEKRSAMILLLLICWVTAGYIVWRETKIGFWWDRADLDWTINPMVITPRHPGGGSAGLDRWLMPSALLGRYIVLLIAPVNLLFEYGPIGWHVEFSDPYLWMGIAVIVLWCALLVLAWWKRDRVAIFLLLALAMTYSMVGNIVALIGVNFAERLMYIPSIFFALLVAMGLQMLPRRAMLALTILLICLGTVRSFAYAIQWNDEIGFLQKRLESQPRSVRLHMALVDAYRKSGRLSEAAVMAERGRALAPDYSRIWWQSGVVAMEQEKFDDAARFFQQSFDLDPDPTISAWMSELSRRAARAATRPRAD